MVKKVIIITSFFFLILFYQCSNKIITKSNNWKDTYNIEPKTGMVVGKITPVYDFIDKKIIIFLTDLENKLVAYDTLSTSHYFIIKNLNPGKYFIAPCLADQFSIQKPQGNIVGNYSFGSNFCYNYYINIESNSITKIIDTVPGAMTDQMRPYNVLSSCQMDERFLELDEELYNYYQGLKKGTIKIN
jgi:hypothetical protein